MVNTPKYYNILCLNNFNILLTLLVFTLVYIKITSSINTYQKTMYLTLLLMYLGVLMSNLNFNFLVPIYFAVELGTIIFILIILRSNSSIFGIESGLHRGGVFFFLMTLLPVIYFSNANMFVKEMGSIFVDFYSNNAVRGDFFGIYILTVSSGYSIMTALLLYVMSLTLGVILFKLFKNFPKNILCNKVFLNDFNLFQKNKDIYFYSKKNIITFFK